MPPESDWGRLDHRSPIERAAINVPAPDLDVPARTIKDDGTTYSPLTNPAAQEHGWSPPADPVPTSAELRARLAAALEALHQANDRLALAQSANDRAQQHLRTCDADLRSFEGLDNLVAEETINQLVGDAVRVELSAEMQSRIAARERARVTYAAAVRAAEQLGGDLVQATGAQAEASSKVERLICALLAPEAERIAEQHADLLRQAGAIATQLLAFNMYSANRGAVLPPSVRAILAGYDVPALARQHDKSAWLNAADVPRQDPQAEVRICAG